MPLGDESRAVLHDPLPPPALQIGELASLQAETPPELVAIQSLIEIRSRESAHDRDRGNRIVEGIASAFERGDPEISLA